MSLRRKPSPDCERWTLSERTVGSSLPLLSSFHSAAWGRKARSMSAHRPCSAVLTARTVLRLVQGRDGGMDEMAIFASGSLERTSSTKQMYSASSLSSSTLRALAVLFVPTCNTTLLIAVVGVLMEEKTLCRSMTLAPLNVLTSTSPFALSRFCETFFMLESPMTSLDPVGVRRRALWGGVGVSALFTSSAPLVPACWVLATLEGSGVVGVGGERGFDAGGVCC